MTLRPLPQSIQTPRAARSKEETLLLMAYADGELDDPSTATERARVEALLASDPEARALLANMTEIAVSSRQWVREAAAASNVHASVPSFDITDAVMASIKQDAKPTKGAENAPIDLAARRAQKSTRATQNMAILGMLAVAAAALFVMRGRSNDPTASLTNGTNVANVANGQMNKTATAAMAAEQAASTSPAIDDSTGSLAQNAIPAAPLDVAVPRAGEIEVNSVAAPNHDVTVFYPQAGDTTASVVVWIDDSKP